MILLLLVAACAGDGGTGPGDGIGASGGVVETGSGSARLTVPAGALSRGVRIGVESFFPAVANANVVLPTAHRFTPAGQGFAVPATLRLAYDDDELLGRPRRALRVARWTGSAWSIVPGAQTVDSAANAVSAGISTLGDYALMRDPCGPADVVFGTEAQGVIEDIDCVFNNIRYSDYWDVTLATQQALTFEFAPSFVFTGGLKEWAEDPRVGQVLYPVAGAAGTNRKVRAILPAGRYQLYVGGTAFANTGFYTIFPTLRTATQVTDSVPCFGEDVAITAGVSFIGSVAPGSCTVTVQPFQTNIPGLAGHQARSVFHALSLKGGRAYTINVTGGSADVYVSVRLTTGPTSGQVADDPAQGTKVITFTPSADGRFVLEVSMSGTPENGFALPPATPYTLSVSP